MKCEKCKTVQNCTGSHIFILLEVVNLYYAFIKGLVVYRSNMTGLGDILINEENSECQD